jgi:hypothetical protein
LADWQAIFLVYIAFAGLTMLWLGLRQPETLPEAARRPLHLHDCWRAPRELFGHRVIVVSILCQTLTLAACSPRCRRSRACSTALRPGRQLSAVVRLDRRLSASGSFI